MMSRLLTISPSPHVHTSRTVSSCMWHVVIALAPALACAFYYFGVGAAVVVATSVAGCLASEFLITKFLLGNPPTLANGSAILTGLLLACNLPSNLPPWIVLIGAVVAIGIGKMAFGGLGCNIFNPALVGRVFLFFSFPAQMNSWPLPLVGRLSYADVSTGATVLGSIKLGETDPSSVDILNLALGNIGGSLGEVGALALLIGFVYLLATRVISWHIPVSILATVALISCLIGSNVWIELLSGGLLLGAVFMATDYVTSPMTRAGMLIYGIMIGVIVMVIRHWGAYPEGVSFAILIMNGVTPLINTYVKPRRFGEGGKWRWRR